jgi:hypothetical protein
MFEEVFNDSVTFLGLITTLIYFLLSITSLVLSSVSFNVINAPWSNSVWRKLAPTELAATISATCVGLIGILTFFKCNNTKPLLGLYIILLILSLLLSLACGIWSAIGGTIRHKHKGLLNCNTELTGILDIWKNVDEYLKYSYSFMCSEFCECDERYKDIFEEFEYSGEYVNTKLFSSSPDNITSFSDCNQSLKDEVLHLYNNNPNNTSTFIKENKFRKYWKKLENRFNCTGWCETKFTNQFTLKEESMFYFLYAGLEKGVPAYPGCLNRIANWISKFLKAIAILMIICGVVQIFNLVLAIVLVNRPYYGEHENENDEDIESSEENNNLNNRKNVNGKKEKNENENVINNE